MNQVAVHFSKRTRWGLVIVTGRHQAMHHLISNAYSLPRAGPRSEETKSQATARRPKSPAARDRALHRRAANCQRARARPTDVAGRNSQPLKRPWNGNSGGVICELTFPERNCRQGHKPAGALFKNAVKKRNTSTANGMPHSRS